ncbi:hypothetical protein Scep_019469 [Stephania cephalantha]|uniref:Uncharacterized protein n=1 Tax=Stephania cephalantha TaxID=152367 RepID=A0AAP0IAY8_9MAGN
MWVLGVLCSSSGSTWFFEVIHERDWYDPSFLRSHTTRSRVKVKANLKPTRLELPPLPDRGAHQALSAALGRSFVALKSEEVKMVKEVLLLKSSDSSSSSSSTTTTTTACGLGGYAVHYSLSCGVDLRFSVLDHQIWFKFGCAAVVSDCFALLRTSSLQGRRISKVEFLKSRKWAIKLKAKLQRRRQKLTHTTSDHPVDDEVVYYKVAGECPKGRVYGLGSLGRKKRRYADLDASTSKVLAQRGMGNFMILRVQVWLCKAAVSDCFALLRTSSLQDDVYRK